MSRSNERIMDRDASKPQPIENEKGSEKKHSSLKEPTSPFVSKEGDCNKSLCYAVENTLMRSRILRW